MDIPRNIFKQANRERRLQIGLWSSLASNIGAEICLLVQVETRSALDQLEAIAAVEGVDGVFIGPADLSASLGHLGNAQHPDAQKAIEDAARRLTAMGKAAGILTGVEAEARR